VHTLSGVIQTVKTLYSAPRAGGIPLRTKARLGAQSCEPSLDGFAIPVVAPRGHIAPDLS